MCIHCVWEHNGDDTLLYSENFIGAYTRGELWSLRKVIRRFIWHNRIHTKAMYRMAAKLFGVEKIPNPFCF